MDTFMSFGISCSAKRFSSLLLHSDEISFPRFDFCHLPYEIAVLFQKGFEARLRHAKRNEKNFYGACGIQVRVVGSALPLRTLGATAFQALP